MKKNPWPAFLTGLLSWLIYIWLMGAVLAWVIRGPLEEILEKGIRFGILWVLSVVALAFFGRTPTDPTGNETK